MVDAYECLDDRRQSEAEDQRPSDCQVIDPGDAQRMQQHVHDVHG